MKEQVFIFFSSNKLTAVLFIIFPSAMAIGTFVESFYSTTVAKILIYNAWWFELILLLFIINFSFNIFKYRVFRKEKWAVLLMHLSLILILLGAFLTRYHGFEGVMPIREGESSNKFLSEKTYLTLYVDGDFEGQTIRKKLQKEILFSEEVKNRLRIKDDFKGQEFEVNYVNYLNNVTEGLVLDSEGERYLKIVEAGDGSRHEHYIKEGEILNIHNVLFTVNNFVEGAVNIQVDSGEYFISSPFDGSFMRMADQYSGKFKSNIRQRLELRSLYSISNFQFVIPDPLLRGRMDIVKADKNQGQTQDALIIELKSNGESKVITLLGGKGRVNLPEKTLLSSLEFNIQYGSVELDLPFSIKLIDFIAEKYPGTEKSYSSFMSKVYVEDLNSFNYDIYMNNVLDHKGYRFFQASFDEDERGTILSVNHDFWGTLVTYTGYFLLYFSLIGLFFIGKTRFKYLALKLEQIKALKSKTIIIFLFIISNSVNAQIHNSKNKIDFDSIIQESIFSKEHAKRFGRLLIQDLNGRMKPTNTFSSELLRKVSKSDEYRGLNSDQVLLSIINSPAIWYNIPIIYLKRGNDSIRNIIKVNNKNKYAPLVSFFDATGTYRLAEHLEKAYKARIPNQFQKDFIEVDKRVNLLYSALQGEVLRIFPIPNHDNNKWVSYNEINKYEFKGLDSLYVKNILPLYFQALRSDQKSNNYKDSNQLLESIKGFQNKYGSEVVISKNKIDAEILYNKYDIFKKLFSWYMYSGTLFFIILLIQIFWNNNLIKKIIIIFKTIIIVLFLLHTSGLIMRWFISGHAPWSDAYESMIYVAWATMFFGLAFGRKSSMTIAATAFVASMTLMIAHWNWLDPAIANLQPVLNSYWLMIHVAVIVASYGPFALGMIIGIIVLLLITLTTKKNKQKVLINIKELTIINELSITVGLIMLTIGNFLGGMWANESWGRYWGWDPKETWALISILIYAFVLHLRLIPGLGGRWFFNIMSIVAFSSILMTYFGVNFYLTGLHSYASGDKIITPDFVYYSILFVFILGAFSYNRNTKYYK
ncbi:MAG: cytochrome c biogenesis protein CcsA [Flavobacteriaceae bacterium]|nr:cytochrome c biogenesis protein CcsA [Flavobacteriaceae bacterium]